MVKVNELPPKTAEKTFKIFKKLTKSFGSKEFNFVLFYGNPTGTEISWCPDCKAIHLDFTKFAQDYRGPVRFHTVPIGSRREFNSDNPFVKNAPNLEAVPTLVVYREGIMCLKLVDPTFQDLTHFAKKYKL